MRRTPWIRTQPAHPLHQPHDPLRQPHNSLRSRSSQPLIEAPLKPINDMVPEALKDFLDVTRIASNVVSNTLVECLKLLVAPVLSGHLQSLATAGGA